MADASQTYADWKAPKEDGAIVVWPDAEALVAQTRENHRRLSNCDVPVQGVPLKELRRRQRQWIGHADDARPLIASGHQTELYHPGVWVKDVLANALARKVGGEAYHFAVDTDSPKHLNVRWPGFSAPLTDDPALTTAEWSGQLAPPTPAHLRQVDEALAGAEKDWSFRPILRPFLDSMRRLSLESLDLSAAVTNATHELDWSLGLRHHAMVTSPLWASEPYLVFVHHVLARAGAFAADYNAALRAYRDANGIKSDTRPMPDLAVRGDAVEAPFWLDDLATGSRVRPTVTAAGDGWALRLANGHEFRFDPAAEASDAAARLAAFCRSTNTRLAPRALPLTLFFRLFLADQFVHGIGGGRYDQVTDLLIRKQFGIDPPRFSVTTATLFFPAAAGRSRVCIPCVVQEGHRLRHQLLGERKRELVAQIAAAPRLSPERRELFFTLHRQLRTAASEHPVLRKWEQRLRDAQQRDAEDDVLFDRELFYATQSRERLETMVERYAQALG